MSFNPQKVPLRKWIALKVSQERVGNDFYLHTYINGELVDEILNPEPREFSNLTVWASDPHHQEANGLIRNFKFNTWVTEDCEVPACESRCGQESGPTTLEWTNDDPNVATVKTFGGDWSNYYTPRYRLLFFYTYFTTSSIFIVIRTGFDIYYIIFCLIIILILLLAWQATRRRNFLLQL